MDLDSKPTEPDGKGRGGNLKLAFVQKRSVLCDIGANVKTIVDSLRDTDADILIFPEIFLTGYVIHDRFFELARYIDCEELDPAREAVDETGKAVVFGMAERSMDIEGQIYNSAVFISPGQDPVSYRKMHLVNFGPFEEYTYFTPGQEPVMVEHNGWFIGLEICYDVFFPELVKCYALSGAGLVVNVSASPSVTKKFFEMTVPARAVESTVFMAYSNVVGTQKALTFWGGAQAWGPRGDRIGKAAEFEEDVLVVELDKEELRVGRRLRPTLRDSRADLMHMAADSR